MWTRRVTIGLLVATLAGLIGWDIYVAANATSGDTISEITLGYARKVWTLPVAVGVVCGHLFWPLRRPRPPWVVVAVLTSVGILTIAIDIVGHPTVMPVLPFAIGALIGHFGWGQRSG